MFSTFLENQRVYNLAEAYWRRFFQQFFSSQDVPFQDFYNRHFINGQKIYDANPIFDAYFPQQHKLVRIIQYIPEPDDWLLTGWIDRFPADELDNDQKPHPTDSSRKDDPIPELVLSLAMTKKNLVQVKELLGQWILEDINGEEMEKILKALN
ncbi:MAG: hypothetical protein J5I94_17605 [Phaeodactylibacter sp.]|nr:hypothetical protein [Phaeodactylibacter sp.]